MASKLKGKEWYQIMVPKLFGDFVIGETMAIDPQLIKGRVVEVSLTDISGDPTRYYFKFFFKVDEIKENKALTKFVGHDCTRDYLARIVRTRTTRIDTNNTIDLLDGKMVVKTVGISNGPISKNIARDLRRNISELVIKELSKMKIEDFLNEMVEGKLQSRIRKVLSKIYPLRHFEFRKTKVI
ncbi:MAG: 40S ribosomal protein S3a/S1 [Candidatus Aenigmatarchaeota archaeon]